MKHNLNIKELYNYITTKNNQKDNNSLVISFYLEINGVLEINKLIELAQSSNISLTKNTILKYTQKEAFIIKENIIYLNPLAQYLDKNINLHKQKKTLPYKTYSLEEIIDTTYEIEQANYQTKIKEILSPIIKDKKNLSNISEFIYNITKVGYDYEDNIQKLLELENIKLTKEQETNLKDIINEMYWCHPTWELNGYRKIDLENEDEADFEELSKKEQIEIYIHIYTTLNGVIEIDKLVEIITKEHNIKPTKQEISKIIKQSETLSRTNQYIHLNELTTTAIQNLMKHKNKLKNYKIIDDINEITTDIFNMTNNLIEIGYKYNLTKEIINHIERIIKAGTLNQKAFQIIIKKECFEISSKQEQALFKELEHLQNQTRVWLLNGYKPEELISNNNLTNS